MTRVMIGSTLSHLLSGCLRAASKAAQSGPSASEDF